MNAPAVRGERVETGARLSIRRTRKLVRALQADHTVAKKRAGAPSVPAIL